MRSLPSRLLRVQEKSSLLLQESAGKSDLDPTKWKDHIQAFVDPTSSLWTISSHDDSWSHLTLSATKEICSFLVKSLAIIIPADTDDPFSIEIHQSSTSLTSYQKSISKRTTLRTMLGLLSLWEQEQWNSLYAHEHSAGGTFSKTRAEQRSWFLPSFVCELRLFSQI